MSVSRGATFSDFTETESTDRVYAPPPWPHMLMVYPKVFFKLRIITCGTYHIYFLPPSNRELPRVYWHERKLKKKKKHKRRVREKTINNMCGCMWWGVLGVVRPSCRNLATWQDLVWKFRIRLLLPGLMTSSSASHSSTTCFFLFLFFWTLCLCCTINTIYPTPFFCQQIPLLLMWFPYLDKS